MKRLFLICTTLIFCACSRKKESIAFVTPSQYELNDLPFKLPGNIHIDSIKEAHNRCMGVVFDGNASLFASQKPFFIGSIVNKKTGNVVATARSLGIKDDKMLSQFSIVTTPCYKKNEFHVPLKSILGENFALQLPASSKEMNNGINKLITASDDGEIETGSWMYMDMYGALKRILDTAASPASLQYKKALLDTANVVLIAAENIMKIDFYITTKKDMSGPVQALLKSKPSALMPTQASLIQPSVKLYYISTNKFQVSVDGFFPMVGQFVKAVLQ